eukprot:5332981-Ditylum_brightwellii.AAC.1
MIGAEKKCRTPKKSGYVWSTKLVYAARTVRYWKTSKFDLFNKRELSGNLLQLGIDLNIPFETLPENTIMLKLTAARKDLCKVQKHVAEIQDEYLEEMVHLKTTKNKSDIATIIKNISHRKEMKSSFHLMHPITNREDMIIYTEIFMTMTK